MLHEYALMPDIFDPTDLYCDELCEVILFTLLSGMSKHSMVADLHKGELRTHLGMLVSQIPNPDPENKRKSPRKDIETCLKMLDSRNRFVRHPRSQNGTPGDNSDWLSLALASHGKLPFDGLIMGDDLYNEKGMSTVAEATTFRRALKSSGWVDHEMDVTLKKRKSEFERALIPVLRHAKKITLIDPFINPGVSRWLNIIDIIKRCTGQQAHAGPSAWKCRIHIHAGNPEKERTAQSPADRLNLWANAMNGLPASFDVTVSLWENDAFGVDLHDRFLITNQCGVACPGGLDCYEDTSTSAKAEVTSTWFLIGESACAQHLAEFDENVGGHSPIAKRKVK